MHRPPATAHYCFLHAGSPLLLSYSALPMPSRAAGDYALQLSASNPNGYSGLSPSTAVSVGFSTKARFWSVQGTATKATLSIIRPDSVSDASNLRYRLTVLKAGDSGSGTFRPATLETHSGNGTLDDPAVIDMPLSAFGVDYAQARLWWHSACLPGVVQLEGTLAPSAALSTSGQKQGGVCSLNMI